MSCSRLPMHKSHSVPNDEIEISQIHLVTDFIEAECVTNWYSGTGRRNSFIGAFYMLEVVSDNIHELEFQRVFPPNLT